MGARQEQILRRLRDTTCNVATFELDIETSGALTALERDGWIDVLLLPLLADGRLRANAYLKRL